jgi:exonuclease III
MAGAWASDKETRTASKQQLVSAWLEDHGVDMALLSEAGVKLGQEPKASMSDTWHIKIAGHDPVREKGACAIVGGKWATRPEAWVMVEACGRAGSEVERLARAQAQDLEHWGLGGKRGKMGVEDRGRLVRVVLTDKEKLNRWHFVCIYGPSRCGAKKQFWDVVLDWLRKLKAAEPDSEVILGGDFNIDFRNAENILDCSKGYVGAKSHLDKRNALLAVKVQQCLSKMGMANLWDMQELRAGDAASFAAQHKCVPPQKCWSRKSPDGSIRSAIDSVFMTAGALEGVTGLAVTEDLYWHTDHAGLVVDMELPEWMEGSEMGALPKGMERTAINLEKLEQMPALKEELREHMGSYVERYISPLADMLVARIKQTPEDKEGIEMAANTINQLLMGELVESATKRLGTRKMGSTNSRQAPSVNASHRAKDKSWCKLKQEWELWAQLLQWAERTHPRTGHTRRWTGTLSSMKGMLAERPMQNPLVDENGRIARMANRSRWRTVRNTWRTKHN